MRVRKRHVEAVEQLEKLRDVCTHRGIGIEKQCLLKRRSSHMVDLGPGVWRRYDTDRVEANVTGSRLVSEDVYRKAGAVSLDAARRVLLQALKWRLPVAIYKTPFSALRLIGAIPLLARACGQ